MSAHTPGQWIAEHDADGDFAIYGNGRLVAITGADSDEDRANVALMISAPEMFEELCALPCGDCGHDLKHHIDKYGCEVDRGDRQVQEVGAVAMGPCGCQGGEYDKKLIALLRKASGVSL